ncbi:alpha/beta fold hydrolase [Barrientosiimonas humi]|uniref:alpha/beta fold hydrolase n=1 Tax=Barrientosiimonas humi TaxID=999931 RepID=UPI00370DA9C5
MAELFVDVGGTRVFVDDRGSRSTAVLYVHGGPGQGSYDLTASVGDLLSRHVRLVAVDQRGALRSDPLPAEPPLTRELLIADFEAVRRELGIERWVLLGHSAGAPVALEYAVAHPDAVSAVIFSCPTFDADLTDRHRLPVAAKRLRELGDEEGAVLCEEIAARPDHLSPADGAREAMQRLGEHYLELFFHNADGQERYLRLMRDSELTDEQRERGMSHLPLIEPMYRSTLGLLPRLRQPHLLVHGIDDLVAAPAMISAYRQTAQGAQVVTLAASGHFPHVEEPAAFAAVVLELVAGLD